MTNVSEFTITMLTDFSLNCMTSFENANYARRMYRSRIKRDVGSQLEPKIRDTNTILNAIVHHQIIFVQPKLDCHSYSKQWSNSSQQSLHS